MMIRRTPSELCSGKMQRAFQRVQTNLYVQMRLVTVLSLTPDRTHSMIGRACRGNNRSETIMNE